MHTFISFDGQVTAAAGAMIPAVSSAALYGKGVFTTIAIRDCKPFLWEKHWQRLRNDAAKVGMKVSEYREATVAEALTVLIERNEVVNGRARVTFFDWSGGGAWRAETGGRTSLLIMTGDLRPVPENFKVTVSPYRVNSTWPLAGVKSCNYLENILAIEEARGRGFDEAVRLNERGEITSGCMSNIFWEKDGKLFTPSLQSGCLAGTTRGDILENEGAVEMDAGIEALDGADAIFLTSAGLGKARAAVFEGRSFK